MAPTRRRGRRRGILSRLIGWTLRVALLTAVAGGIGGWFYVRHLEGVVRERIEGGRTLDVPTVVLAAPVSLRTGETLSHSRVREALTRAGWASVDAVTGPRQFRLSTSRLEMQGPEGDRHSVSIRGGVVTDIRPGGTGPGGALVLPSETLAALTGAERTRRALVPLARIPASVQDAVLAIEDHRFHQHPGVDLRGLARAAWVNVRAGARVQGGSTLTQQLAKNLFLTPDKRYTRKIREVATALAIERRYPKDRILELYLNQVYLGQRGGYALHGVGEGARAFFGKPIEDLDTDEAALLAGVIQSPNRYAPWKHPEAARERRDQVLQRMVDVGRLSAAEAKVARSAPLSVRAGGQTLARQAPWVVERVRDELDAVGFDERRLAAEGLRVVTTLDASFQAAGERAVEEGLRALEQDYPTLRRRGTAQAALVALDPRSGDVLAWVGGRDYGESQFDRVGHARRQPGSAWKPLALAAAFEALPGTTSGSMTLLDSPLTLEAASGKAWSPSNYDGRDRGLITLREAVWDSRNLPFVRLGQQVGWDRIAQTARDLGLTSPLRPLPSLVLGAQEVTPLELATLYAAFANGGKRVTPRFLRELVAGDGTELRRWGERPPEPTLRPDTAFLVTDLLRGVMRSGTAARCLSLGVKLPAAGKTGTTDEGRDAWFAGYTPDLVVVVWVGFDDDHDLGLTGAQAALPLWARFVSRVAPYLSGRDFVPAPGLEESVVCDASGHQADAACPGRSAAYFRRGTLPPGPCPLHGDGAPGQLNPWPPDADAGPPPSPPGPPEGTAGAEPTPAAEPVEGSGPPGPAADVRTPAVRDDGLEALLERKRKEKAAREAAPDAPGSSTR